MKKSNGKYLKVNLITTYKQFARPSRLLGAFRHTVGLQSELHNHLQNKKNIFIYIYNRKELFNNT